MQQQRRSAGEQEPSSRGRARGWGSPSRNLCCCDAAQSSSGEGTLQPPFSQTYQLTCSSPRRPQGLCTATSLQAPKLSSPKVLEKQPFRLRCQTAYRGHPPINACLYVHLNLPEPPALSLLVCKRIGVGVGYLPFSNSPKVRTRQQEGRDAAGPGSLPAPLLCCPACN